MKMKVEKMKIILISNKLNKILYHPVL